MYQFSTVTITNCYSLSRLKQHDFIMSQLCRSPVWAALTVSLAWFPQGRNQGVGRLGSYWETLGTVCCQVHSGCCQNPVPYSCKPEGPISFPAVSWGLLLAPRGLPWVLARRPLHLKASRGTPSPSCMWCISDSPSAVPFCFQPTRQSSMLSLF